MKSFWHEYARENVAGIYEGLPSALAPQLEEGAFSMEEVTFGGWHDGVEWTLRGNARPMAEELSMLTGDPAQYGAFAVDYYEIEAVPLDAIAHVLAGEKLDAKVVRRITTERTLADLKPELAEIGY